MYLPSPKQFGPEGANLVVRSKLPPTTLAMPVMRTLRQVNPGQPATDLLRAVDRPAFGVHLDVCNGVNCPRRFYNNGDFIGECFRKLGRWIVSCHAKDLQWITELNIHFQEVVPGRGQIDYRRYLTELNRLAADTPLMIEHLKTAI